MRITRKFLHEDGTPIDLDTLRQNNSFVLLLEGRARLILTDSGGVQKEAYFARVPCLTLRDETEWLETLENRCNVLTGPDERKMLEAARACSAAGPWSDAYGDGHAGEHILRALLSANRNQRR